MCGWMGMFEPTNTTCLNKQKSTQEFKVILTATLFCNKKLQFNIKIGLTIKATGIKINSK